MIPHSIWVFAVLATFTSAAPVIAQPRTIAGYARVVDGDTLYAGPVKVRLQGVHAPERHALGGREATAWMVRATAGRIVTCHLDGSRTHDRAVGRCFVGGRDLAADLIAAGLARDCPRYSGARYRMYERPEAVRFGLPKYCAK